MAAVSQVDMRPRMVQRYLVGIVAAAALSAHAYIIFGIYVPDFLKRERPEMQSHASVAFGLTAVYIACVWILTRVLKPGSKAGIPSGKPFSSGETKALHLFTKWAESGSGKVVTEASVASFAQECRAKADRKSGDDKAAERARLASQLAARDPEDVLGRMAALRAPTIDVTGAKAVYNLYQVGFNCVMAYILFREAWRYADGDVMKLWATRPDPSLAGNVIQMGMWLHYVNKFLEFADTAFMAASGNWRQVTTLHVVHHSIMGPIWWSVLTSPSGPSLGCTQGWFGAWINSCIHVMMYSYYFLSAVGARMDWFRLPLTTMQLLQFCAAFVQAIVMLYYRAWEGAHWPLPMSSIILEFALTILMMVMFGDFFVKAYCSKPAKAKKE